MRRWPLSACTLTLPMLVLSFIPTVVFAKDLGSFGQTYPIQETNFLTFIHSRIEKLEANGGWNDIIQKTRKRVVKKIIRPKPVEGITKATENKTRIFDPSITVSNSIFDNQGHLVAAKGTKINPLNLIQLHKRLIFFNGDDKAQVSWVKNNFRKADPEKGLQDDKLILVNGSVLDQVKTFKHKVFFDQKGTLTKHFHIKHVPSVISQKGDKLVISEVKV